MIEFLLTLYVVSGLFKAFFSFYGISLPVDFTLLTSALLLCGVFYANHTSKKRGHLTYSRADKITILSSNKVMILFWLWMIFSLTWTSSEAYCYTKTIHFLTNIIVILAIGSLPNFDISKMVRFLSIAAIAASLCYFPIRNLAYNDNAFYNDEWMEIGGLYLSIGEILGTAIMCLVTTKVPIFKSKKYDFAFIIVMLICLLIIGSRGPLIFTVLCIVLYLISQKKIALILEGGVAVFVIGLLMNFLSSHIPAFGLLYEISLSRLELLLTGFFTGTDMGDSVSTRVSHFGVSIDTIFASVRNFIAGTGIGSFGIEAMGRDTRAYPHNILLEVWFELGLVGLIMFISYFIKSLKGLFKPRNVISVFVLLYMFLNLSKSSSLLELRSCLTMVALFNFPSNIPGYFLKSNKQQNA